MYPQQPTSPVAVQHFSGQKWVNLAFILALIAIVVVVALSLLGPTLGNSIAGAELKSPAPSLSTSHPEGNAATSSLPFDGDLTGVETAYSLPQ